ncbi:class I SAM-dependent methyltransferase [Algoriphagus mannitolivorans]|uniref:class I SAM-dependent methyltransferase n=1 Tax=Algoriphagus mannitolivorans TaxID=226504 RepID=UPI0004080179|nr:class I SAM-dependent methyltransferase [Algoriphagus mannitolivorans]
MPTDFSGKSCPYCGSTDQQSFLAEERMLGKGDKFSYLECLSCGSLHISKVPENLGDYYPKSYYSFQELQFSNPLFRWLKRLRMSIFGTFGIFSPIYGYWLKKLRPSRNARIADVGCGNGQLLYELYCGGFQNLEGYDPFIAKEVRISSGLSLFPTEFEKAVGNFDLIMMHHAFEHMEDPKKVLTTCWEKLNPGGKLLLRLPVADSQVWKEKGNLWVQLDAPRHLTIPSVKGLQHLGEKIGLKLDELEFDSNEFQFWGTELYERGEKLDSGNIDSVFSKPELSEMQKKALRFNQEGIGDQACFYFSKPLKS